MTVSTTTIKNSHSGNGTAHSFAYGFKIFADADLDVIVRSSTGTETVKTLNTDYIVTNAGSDSGGNVLFKFNTGTSSDAHFSSSDKRPQNGETVILRRGLDITQSTDYVANDPFPAESHENALDRLTLISQELQEELDRSIKLSRTNTMTSTEFTVGATDRASKVLAFDSSGEISVTQELGTFKGDWAASTAYVIRDIVKDTSTNNIFIVTEAHTSSGSQPLTTNANSAKYSLIVDAASATTSATNAASSATAAASSATAAASSASTASTQASNASTSASTASTQATNAASSATAAANAQAAAEAALDTFDDRFLGAKSSNPTVDNDGNALLDGALYFDTTNDIMKVYDLTNNQWRQLTLTSTNQTNVNTVAGAISNVNTVAGANSNITTVASDISDINTVAGISSNVTTVAGISSNVTSVAGNSTNINSAVSNATNINTVAGAITNVNNVGGSIANVNTVASNLSGVNSFAERYRVQSGVPGSDNDVGDLVFDTAANTLKVFGSSGFQNAGSSVNGTSDRFTYNITGTPTTLTGASGTGFAEANSNTLAYDAGFIDVYLNGVKMVNGTDVTVTSGTSVVFASALSNGDVVDIVTFGTFQVANIVSTGALNSGSITSGFGNIDTGSSTITTTGAITGGTLTGTLQTAAQTNITSVGTLSGLAVSGATTITTADNNAQLTLISTDTDANRGPILALTRNSGSPADNDIGGTIKFNAKNDASEDIELFEINTTITDASDGTEDAKMTINGIIGGASTNRLNLNNTETVFNEDGVNLDFRVETDDETHALFIKGSSGKVGLGTSSPDAELHIEPAEGGSNASIIIANNGRSQYYRIQNNESDDAFTINSNDTSERFRIGSTGHVLFHGITGRATGSTGHISISDQSSNRSMLEAATTSTAAKNLMVFLNPNGAVGTITTSGSSTSFNTSSDYRLKESITYDFDATTRLKKLKPCRFNFKTDADTTVDGFLAHEVSHDADGNPLVPEAITGTHNEVEVWEEGEELPNGVSVGDNKLDDDGNTIPNYQQIDQSKLIPLLTKALQEQQATIESLTARITALESA